MNGYLLTSAILLSLLALLHSFLGERYVIRPLCSLEALPRLFGSRLFMKRVLRFAWHLTTILLVSLAFVMAVKAHPSTGPISKVEGSILVGAPALCSLLSAFVTRGRHFSWVVFLAAALLVLLGLGT